MILQMMLLTHTVEVRASCGDRFKEKYLFYHVFLLIIVLDYGTCGRINSGL